MCRVPVDPDVKINVDPKTFQATAYDQQVNAGWQGPRLLSKAVTERNGAERAPATGTGRWHPCLDREAKFAEELEQFREAKTMDERPHWHKKEANLRAKSKEFLADHWETSKATNAPELSVTSCSHQRLGPLRNHFHKERQSFKGRSADIAELGVWMSATSEYHRISNLREAAIPSESQCCCSM